VATASTPIGRIGPVCVAFLLSACGSEAPEQVSSGGADACQGRPGASALCLTFSPEAMTPEREPGLDLRGFLRLQVFDRATPPAVDVTSSGALFERTFPADFADGGEIALSDLPETAVVLNDPPALVYVRALFFDRVVQPAAPRIDWGTWLGGFDLSKGISGIGALVPVQMAANEITMHEIELTSLRRLTANITTSIEPIGDGEGALSVVASRIEKLPPLAQTYGYGIIPCADVTLGPKAVEMFLLGSGRFFVEASFEDLGIETPGEMPPGTMLSLRDVDLVAGTGTFDEITLGSDQYSASVSLDLGFMSPLAGDPGALGPNSCADLGLPGPPR
jgi:hypothetical protein